MTVFEILIKGGTVVTVDEERRVIPTGTVGISEGRIVAVEDASRAQDWTGETVIDAHGEVVMPGFINVHTHCLHSLMRGGPSDPGLHRSLGGWIYNALDPAMRAQSPAEISMSARLFVLEAIRSGITTIGENVDYGFDEATWNAAIGEYERSGLTWIVGDVFSDRVPDTYVDGWKVLEASYPEVVHADDAFPFDDTDVALARIESRMKRFVRRSDSPVTVCPSPVAPVLNTQRGLLGARDLAKRMNTPIFIHAAEAPEFERGGLFTDVEYLAAIGFLGPNVLATHMVDVTPSEISVLVRNQVNIGYAPSSGMNWGRSTAPIVEYLNAGLNIGLALDDPCENQSVNMISDMRLAMLQQTQQYGPNLMAETVLEMATIGGAKALGIDHEVGSISPGKRADVVVLDLRAPHTTPSHSIPSVLVYQANGSEVSAVVARGQVLMAHGQLTGMDEEAEKQFLEEVQSCSVTVLERARMGALRERGWRSG